MPLLTRTLIKTAMVYFSIALLLGILMAVRAPTGMFPVYIHLLVFGWLTQLIFGVIYWMFPKYSKQTPRGHEALGWITYGALNLGMEFLLLGWMVQLAMGVAFWILPRFGSGAPRGNELLIWTAFVALNLGIWMAAFQPYHMQSWLTLIGRILEAVSVFLFVFGSWQRVKPLEA